MATDLQRVTRIVDWLVFDQIVNNRRDLADKMGYTESSLSQILNAKVALSAKFIKKLANIDRRINEDWILTGGGDMLKPPTRHLEIGGDNLGVGNINVSGGRNANFGNVRTGGRSNVHDAKVGSDGEGAYNMVPVYNFDAVGGMTASNGITDSPAFVERYVPFIGARQDDICVHVTGNSMAPIHCSGSLLLLREVECWREYFGYGHCFVLFLKDGRRILKEVQRFDANPQDYVLCVSHNKDYPAEELPKSMITAVYKVIMALTNEGF